MRFSQGWHPYVWEVNKAHDILRFCISGCADTGLATTRVEADYKRLKTLSYPRGMRAMMRKNPDVRRHTAAAGADVLAALVRNVWTGWPRGILSGCWSRAGTPRYTGRTCVPPAGAWKPQAGCWHPARAEPAAGRRADGCRPCAGRPVSLTNRRASWRAARDGDPGSALVPPVRADEADDRPVELDGRWHRRCGGDT